MYISLCLEASWRKNRGLLDLEGWLSPEKEKLSQSVDFTVGQATNQ